MSSCCCVIISCYCSFSFFFLLFLFCLFCSGDTAEFLGQSSLSTVLDNSRKDLLYIPKIVGLFAKQKEKDEAEAEGLSTEHTGPAPQVGSSAMFPQKKKEEEEGEE